MYYKTIDEVNRYFRSHIDIPPPSEQAMEIRAKADDMDDLIESVEATPVLAHEVLDVVNAPFFSLVREIGSVAEGVRLLGPQKILNLATTRAMYLSLFAKKGKAMEKFWQLSTKLAVAAVVVSKALKLGLEHEVYTAAVFQNTGIPLLYMKFKKFGGVLSQAYHSSTGEISRIEAESCQGLHHAGVSALVAKDWGLDEHLVEAICISHDPNLIKDSLHNGQSDLNDVLVACKLAEEVVRLPMYIIKEETNHEFEAIKEDLMLYIKKPPTAFERIKMGILKQMAEYRGV